MAFGFQPTAKPLDPTIIVEPKRFGAVSPLARIITLPGGWRLVCEVVKEPIDVSFGEKIRLIDAS